MHDCHTQTHSPSTGADLVARASGLFTTCRGEAHAPRTHEFSINGDTAPPAGGLRGQVHSDYEKRPIRWPGMRWGKITPTDIDFWLEFGGALTIMAEAKHHSGTMGRGQELTLERAADGLAVSSRAIAAYVVHGDCDVVDIGQAVVRRYWIGGTTHGWVRPQRTVRFDAFCHGCVAMYSPRHARAAQ